jgi:osmotically inducible protein OsmC
MKRKGSAVWKGGLKDGKGTVSTDSGVLSNTQYSFSTRFEDGKGTNPEELIAAAHAGCFSMALSAQLGNAGMTAESIATTATVNLEKTDAGFTITAVHLDVKAKIPGADKAPSIRPPTTPRPVVPCRGCSTRRSRWTPRSRPERMPMATFAKLNLKDQAEIVVLNAPASFEPELKSLKGVTVRRDAKGGDIGFLAGVRHDAEGS